jgi:hypothetical protein
MRIRIISALLFVLISLPVIAQKVIGRKKFFKSDSLIEATLKTDFYKLSTDKKDSSYQPATITWHNVDSAGDVSEEIGVKLRGFFRRTQCSFASIMFNFKDSTKTSGPKSFKHLKITVPCEWGSEDEQYLLKEYMVYKIYQLYTNLSFRVRLIHFRFEDVSGKIKPYTQYGFALEPIDDLAKRNGFKEQDKRKVLSEQTNRLHTTFVSIFEYMIGNLDWAIPPHHNIKIVAPKDSADVPPYIIPHDFDFSGAVNALYATPPPDMKGIEKVTERRYRGFKRTMDEVKPIVARFLEKEQDVYKLIADFKYFKPGTKKEMTSFFEDFFNEMRDEKNVQKVFVDEARISQ